MRVLLVQLFLGRTEKNGCIFPLGLCYIATSLENNGHQIRLLDTNLYSDPHGILAQEIYKFQPEILGLSLRNIDTVDKLDFHYYYSSLSDTLHSIKKISPNIPLMIGGAGFSTFADKIMERHTELDFGVYLEGEETVVELLNNLDMPEKVKGLYYRRYGKVFFTGKRAFSPFNTYPWPRRDFAEIQKYVWPLSIGIQSRRGCELDCAYCNYPLLNGERLRGRTVNDVVDEIEYLNQTFGIKEVIFTDSIFNLPQLYAVEICQEIIKRKVNIRWSAWFDVLEFTEEFLELARKSGCYRMCFSPDAASNRTLEALGKRFSEKDVRQLLNIAKHHTEIDFRFTLFCTPPNQDFRDLVKAICFFFETHVLMRNSRCLISWLRVLPGTKMYQIALKEGFIDQNTDLLPQDKEKARKLFYTSASTKPYGTVIFVFLNSLFSITREIIKLIFPLVRDQNELVSIL